MLTAREAARLVRELLPEEKQPSAVENRSFLRRRSDDNNLMSCRCNARGANASPGLQTASVGLSHAGPVCWSSPCHAATLSLFRKAPHAPHTPTGSVSTSRDRRANMKHINDANFHFFCAQCDINTRPPCSQLQQGFHPTVRGKSPATKQIKKCNSLTFKTFN